MPMRRPEVFGGKRFLLKSIHYDATHRADLFTLPCSFKAVLLYIIHISRASVNLAYCPACL